MFSCKSTFAATGSSIMGKCDLISLPENAYDLAESATSPLVHIIRHGQSLHNLDRGYPHLDPPLTDVGHEATKQIKISVVPDLIVISPMTRTIQTAMNAFPSISSAPNRTKVPEVQIWPDLREAHDAVCNKGISRAESLAKYPHVAILGVVKTLDYLRI